MGKGLFGLLKREAYKNKNSLPKAIAFVDYEHWFISMEKIHHAKPNIQAWFNDLKKKCNIVEVIFFADFSSLDIVTPYSDRSKSTAVYALFL